MQGRLFFCTCKIVVCICNRKYNNEIDVVQSLKRLNLINDNNRLESMKISKHMTRILNRWQYMLLSISLEYLSFCTFY